MDTVTHTLIGFFLTVVLLHLYGYYMYRRRVLWCGIIATFLLDLDIFLRFFGDGYYLVYHRTLTHSLFGVVIFALFLAAAFTRKKDEFGMYFRVAFFGFFAHVLYDLFTSWGTAILYPISETRFAVEILPIIDIWLWIILIGAFVLWLFRRESELRIAAAALGLAVVFTACMGLFGIIAEISNGPHAESFPTFVNPVVWNIIEKGNGEYISYQHNVFTRERTQAHHYPISDHVLIEQSKGSSLVEQYLRFSSYAVPEVVGADAVEWYDLRFMRDGKAGFVLRIDLDEDGGVVRERMISREENRLHGALEGRKRELN